MTTVSSLLIAQKKSTSEFLILHYLLRGVDLMKSPHPQNNSGIIGLKYFQEFFNFKVTVASDWVKSQEVAIIKLKFTPKSKITSQFK